MAGVTHLPEGLLLFVWCYFLFYLALQRLLSHAVQVISYKASGCTGGMPEGYTGGNCFGFNSYFYTSIHLYCGIQTFPFGGALFFHYSIPFIEFFPLARSHTVSMSLITFIHSAGFSECNASNFIFSSLPHLLIPSHTIH